MYRALNLNTGQMVAVKRIGLEGLKEEEIAQLMREVDLVKRLSHPSIVKYEGMARDENTLSIVLECVVPFLLYIQCRAPACPLACLLLRILFCTWLDADFFFGRGCASRVHLPAGTPKTALSDRLSRRSAN